MIRIHCKCEEDTVQAAKALASLAGCSDVLLLSGEMGAGKSVFTRAFARAMGVEGPVPSPTFTILLIHDGLKEKLYHFDLYRLENEDELYGMGLDEMIPPDDGIAVIEWPEICASAMPEEAIRILIEYDPEDIGSRFVNIEMPDLKKEQALIGRLQAMNLETDN